MSIQTSDENFISICITISYGLVVTNVGGMKNIIVTGDLNLDFLKANTRKKKHSMIFPDSTFSVKLLMN